jgi:type IV secretory pathway VirB10-like protein
MTAAAAGEPLAKPTVATDIRAETPKAQGLPSRKILLAGASILGAAVAFAILNGMSERPRRLSTPETNAAPQAATPPEALQRAPSTYDEAGFATVPVPPEDALWAANGQSPPLPSETQSAGPPAAAPPPSQAIARDLALEERQAARGSPIRFAAANSSEVEADPAVHPSRLAPPPARTILQAGAVIPASLQTGINSDVPGLVTALVTAPVHDSLTGDHLLIPQGSRLVGAYQDGVTYGDRRLRVLWTRLILPNGWSMSLSGLEASDVTGAAGLPAEVDNQVGRLAVASLASGALATAANAAEDDDDDRIGPSVANAAAQEAASVGGRIVDRELQVRPTLRVPAGAPVRIIVSRDLVLRPYGE